VLAALQVADGGFYSDDWGIQWDWHYAGYAGAVDDQQFVLGSKPLLAYLLPGSYELLGTSPAWHHAMAAVLALATTSAFYLVLRRLDFEVRDALPVSLLVLLFPWVTGLRLWPTGSLNNVAVLLLFAGLLIALRALRVRGAPGLLGHLAASGCYAAAVFTYDATATVALLLWPIYFWKAGRRAGLPRAAMDVAAVGAAALWTKAHTTKDVRDVADQIGHIPDILGGGAKLIAGSLLPLDYPADLGAVLTAAVLAAVLAVLVAAALRGGEGRRWAAIGAVALAGAFAGWAVFLPQAFYTPTFQGLEDRVNVVAVYFVAIFVWSALRAAGTLVPRNGHVVALAGCALILAGYWANDLRQQRDWLDAADEQQPVLEAVEAARPEDNFLVLTFGAPGETGPQVPVFNQSWDLHPAAQLRTGWVIHTYPVFEGAELRCAPKGVAIDELPTPLYWQIAIKDRGTPGVTPYGAAIFADVPGGRHELIRSRGQCERALGEFEPGPWEG
jgi:hypothetical protein